MRKIFLFFLILIIIPGIDAAGANRAEIILSKSIDVPDRTVSFENQTFEVTEIGNYKTNQDISLTVEAPGMDDMLIVLYDRDRLSTWFKRVSNTSGRVVAIIPANRIKDAGTYAITVSHERNTIAAIPVVISDYDLAVKPGIRQIVAGRTLDVEVRISKNGAPANVENPVKVVLARGSSSIEANASATKTGVYEAHIVIPQPATGTFSLYSVIATERNLYINYPEIIGVESGGYIEILPPPAEKTSFVSGAATAVILLSAALFMRKRS